ncbi:hypothetical protein Tco_0567405, partial [Tanacetum coccineum]
MPVATWPNRPYLGTQPKNRQGPGPLTRLLTGGQPSLTGGPAVVNGGPPPLTVQGSGTRYEVRSMKQSLESFKQVTWRLPLEDIDCIQSGSVIGCAPERTKMPLSLNGYKTDTADGIWGFVDLFILCPNFGFCALFYYDDWLERMEPGGSKSNNLVDKIRNIDVDYKMASLFMTLRGVVQVGSYVESLDGSIRAKDSGLHHNKTMPPIDEDASEIFGEPAAYVNVIEENMVNQDTTTKSTAFTYSFANILNRNSNLNKKIVKLQELRNPERVEGAAVAIPMEAVEEFNTKEGMESVMESGPWLVRGVPLILNIWNQNSDLKKDVIKSAPLWVKLHHVPIVAYSEIAEEELKDSIVIAIPLINGKGHTLAKIDVEYEWNPPRCNTCKVFDHVNDKCPKNPKVDVPSKAVNDGFTVVTKRKSKPNQKNKQVEGVRLSKPALNLQYRRVDKAESSKNNDKNSFGALTDDEDKGDKTTTILNEDSDCEEVDEEMVFDDRNGQMFTTKGASTPVNKGDFNATLFLEESTAGSSRIDIAMREFKECVDDIEVVDVTNSGLQYTGIQKQGRLRSGDLRRGTFLKQKAKFYWLKEGDSNSAYFHKAVKSRVSRSRIDVVTNGDGVLFENENVPSAFVDHYEAFLGQAADNDGFNDANLFKNCLEEQEALFMVRSISDREVKEALFSMGDDKSPGPDGYTAAFFKEAWDIVGDEVTKAIREFFTNGKLLKELNHTIIALIPKVKSPSRVNDYRPISCCNVLFKCISKIIANRIKQSLKILISPNQSAFIPGRSISDNILLTQELMHNYHLDRGTPRCAFKVDIQKAYDTVDWVFLRKILKGFGFHDRMVSWIMECVTTTSYSISINGILHGYFRGKRGLRQGDPLSPYLFTLVMEVLTLMLQRRVMEADNFSYHRYCAKLDLINLCFADDLFLFAYGDVQSARIIKDSLDEFKHASGLTPSLPKSTAYFCNVLNHVKLSILNVLPFEEGRLPVKYLGVPLVSSRLMVRDCKELVEKVQSRVQDWKNKSLSIAGRLQLIRSVIGSMHIFWASVFVIPTRVLLDIEQI